MMKASYFPFLRKLLTTGQYRWETPETSSDEKIVSTLYLDGDMLCRYPEDELGLPVDLPRDTLDAHLHKINHDLQSFFALANHFIAGLSALIVVLAIVLRPSAWLEGVAGGAAIALIMRLFRKWLMPMIIRLAGRMLGRMFQMGQIFF